MPTNLREVIAAIVLLVVFGAIACGIAYTLVAIVRNHKPNQRRRAIWLYARQLGTKLQAKYGKQATYTPLQVKTTLTEWGYRTDYDCYGLAMYCNDAEFGEYHRSIDEDCNYEAMRSEINECLFNPDRDSSPASLGEASFQFDPHRYPSQSSRWWVSRLWAPQSHHHAGESADPGHDNHHDAGGYTGGDFGGETY